MNPPTTYAEQPIQVISDGKEIFKILKSHDLSTARIFILADSNTSEHCLPLIQEHLPGGGRNAILLDIPADETSKSLEMAHHLYTRLMEHHADRHSLLLNLGGGVVTDLGGFVGSTYKRGMKFIHMPTTVLGQVDAAIGGKTGVNHLAVKNMVGTFQFPLDTIIFPDFLKTLPKREVLSGFAEMIKHAIIGSETLWNQMLNAEFVHLPFIQSQISDSTMVKRNIVTVDPHEHGERKVLNYGHTLGHALESYALESPDKDLLHGEAIALGMMAETYISHKKGYITEGLMVEINGFIAQHFEGIELHQSQYHRILEIVRQDKKGNKEKLNMTLIKGIGKPVINKNPDMELLIDSLIYLERYPFSK